MKLVLIVGTILFSLFLGVKRSNLDTIFILTNVEIDLSSANDIFENSFNNNKIKFEYQVEDLTEINTSLSEISKTENTITLYLKLKNILSFKLIIFSQY